MQTEQVLFSLPLSRLEPIFKKWVSDVIQESTLGENQTNTHGTDPLTVKQAADYLGVSQQTIYQNIRRIPHSKRFGKLYFLRSDLDLYLAEGKIDVKK